MDVFRIWLDAFLVIMEKLLLQTLGYLSGLFCWTYVTPWINFTTSLFVSIRFFRHLSFADSFHINLWETGVFRTCSSRLHFLWNKWTHDISGGEFSSIHCYLYRKSVIHKVLIFIFTIRNCSNIFTKHFSQGFPYSVHVFVTCAHALYSCGYVLGKHISITFGILVIWVVETWLFPRVCLRRRCSNDVFLFIRI